MGAIPRNEGRRRAAAHGIAATVRRAAAADRGSALITAVVMLTIMGFFLFGFQALNRNELFFAGYSRNSTLAFNLAEAGVQEGIKRLNVFGGIPGATCFPNSLTSGAACSGSTSSPAANTVSYQAVLSSNSAIFPILSLASFAGAPRGVRIFEQVAFKSGFGDTIIGPQVTFQGDASPVVGDTYSDTSIVFASYAKSPPPGTGATATNLVGPQVLGGTTICDKSGSPGNCTASPYKYECAGGSTQEVAPTACTGAGGRAQDGSGNPLPVNWHPMTPLGMSKGDFTAVINQCYTGACQSTFGITIVPAQQGGAAVTYTTPASYTPTYWTLSGSGAVLLAVATKPFCVTGSTVSLPSGSPLSCGSGNFYGQTGATMRYLDWGLVQDDLTRGTAQTFFQPPSCAAPCPNGGKQNGVQYVPLLPSLNVTGLACQQNVSPGTNVFDQVNTGDGISCSPPVQTISSTTVTFSGTKSSPESLVIDNAGSGTVQITGSIPGNNTLTCSNTNFDNYNWGIIFATGDVNITANTVFTGFIYTPGNVSSQGNVLVQGGIFSSNSPSSGSAVNQVDDLGTVNFCAGSSSQVVLNPQFYTFSTLSWQDRPLGQP